jgi:hypothetical protein
MKKSLHRILETQLQLHHIKDPLPTNNKKKKKKQRRSKQKSHKNKWAKLWKQRKPSQETVGLQRETLKALGKLSS